MRDNLRNRRSSRVHIKSFSRPHTVSGPSSTSSKEKFMNYPLCCFPRQQPGTRRNSQMPSLPGADECHQLVDEAVDVTVSIQQQVSTVQVVQSSSTDEVVQRTGKMRQIQFIKSCGHSSCVTETGTHRAVEAPVVKRRQVLIGAVRENSLLTHPLLCFS